MGLGFDVYHVGLGFGIYNVGVGFGAWGLGYGVLPWATAVESSRDTTAMFDATCIMVQKVSYQIKISTKGFCQRYLLHNSLILVIVKRVCGKFRG